MIITNSIDIDDNQLLLDSYTGGGGFLDGSYIFKHKREDTDKWMLRRKLSYYSNFVKPVIHSLTNPIFKATIIRNWVSDNDAVLTNFRDDVDCRGTPINAFMKRAAKLARLDGVVFIVEDNFSLSQMPGSKEAALSKRIFPYLYLVKRQQIVEYKCNRRGVLESITYKISTGYDENTRRLPNQSEAETWTWTTNAWICKSGGEVRQGQHPLGRVPVVPLFSTEPDDGDMLPVSPMLAIARTNLTIFNLCSELREILSSQAFSIMRYPVNKDIMQDVLQKGITIGTDNLLPYPAEAGNGPDFIAPSSEPAILLQNEIKRLVEDIYRQANLTSVVAVQTKQSGIAKEWDFEQTNQSLADMAENCEAAEIAIFNLFGAWTNIDIKELKIKYERDFGIADIGDELMTAQSVIDLGVGPTFVKEVLRKIAEKYLDDIDDDRYAAVIDEIEKMSDEKKQEQVFGDGEE